MIISSFGVITQRFTQTELSGIQFLATTYNSEPGHQAFPQWQFTVSVSWQLHDTFESSESGLVELRICKFEEHIKTVFTQ
jgi:hypothetical protein